MIAVNNLGGIGKLIVGNVPNPQGPIPEHDRTRRWAKGARPTPLGWLYESETGRAKWRASTCPAGRQGIEFLAQIPILFIDVEM